MRIPKDKLARTKQWIQAWVDNKMDRLKESVKRTRKKKKEWLNPEFDSMEAQMAVWEAVWDLKGTLEFAEGSVFTHEDPLKVPEWKKVEELIQKLLTVEEIQKHNAE